MRVLVPTSPFDANAHLAAFLAAQDGRAGAVASFIGLCRAEHAGGAVLGLYLDHYPGFCEAEIGRMADAAKARFDLLDGLIVHRAGAIAPGEAIVLVAAAAAHRRAAFQAVDHLMDYLKTEAPFWKLEERAGGRAWVEPRAEDHAEKARWEIT